MTRKVLVALASLPSACALVIVPTALPPSSTMTVAQEMRYAVVQPLDAQQQLIFPTNLIAEKVDTSAVVSEFVGSVKGGIESGAPVVEQALKKTAAELAPVAEKGLKEAAASFEEAKPYLKKTAEDLAPVAEQAGRVLAEDLAPALTSGLLSAGKAVGGVALSTAKSASLAAADAAKGALSSAYEKNVDSSSRDVLSSGGVALAKGAEETAKFALPAAQELGKQASPYVDQAADAASQSAGRAARDLIRGLLSDLDTWVE